jgi:hypothetical protein
MFGTVVCFSFVCAVPFHAAVFGARDAIMGKRGPEHAAANKRPERNNPPPDNKPIEDKPIENKPIENKPIENKPIDKKPEENKPIENKPIEKKPVEKKPPPRVTGDEALDQTLADLGDEKTVVAAAGKLAGMKPNQHQAVVAQRLGDTLRTAPVYNRTALLRAMQKWATPTEVPLLLQLLEDKDINTRNEVLQVLGKVPDERAVRPVVRCFSEFQTTYHGELALIEMGSIAEKEVLPLATGPNRGLWVPALRVLKEIGTLHSVPTLQILTKGDITVQDAAQQAVAAIYARNKKK